MNLSAADLSLAFWVLCIAWLLADAPARHLGVVSTVVVLVAAVVAALLASQRPSWAGDVPMQARWALAALPALALLLRKLVPRLGLWPIALGYLGSAALFPTWLGTAAIAAGALISVKMAAHAR